MATTIPIHVYEILEDRLGREEAKQLVHEIEASADALATQKKVEIRDELRNELVTKEEFHSEMKALRSEMAAMEARLEKKIDALEWKLRLYFLILLFTIILVSPRALDLIGKLLGVVK